jgi:hypothetical protein
MSQLAHVRVVDVRTSGLDDEGQRLLGTGNKLLIVRPDGYIGFRGSIEKRVEWQAYAQQDGLKYP